jgi:Holliday junction DNA helicase RuvA
LDLKDKAPGVMAMGGTVSEAMDGPALEDVVEPATPASAPKKAKPAKPKAPSGAAAASAGALSALANLGYGPSDAAAAVAEAAGDNPDAGEAELIRAALRLLAPKG